MSPHYGDRVIIYFISSLPPLDIRITVLSFLIDQPPLCPSDL